MSSSSLIYVVGCSAFITKFGNIFIFGSALSTRTDTVGYRLRKKGLETDISNQQLNKCTV